MSNLLEDPKFKADILTGYDALTKLLHHFDAGAKLHDWGADGEMYDVDEHGMPKTLQDLELLRATLRSLIVGARIEQVRQ